MTDRCVELSCMTDVEIKLHNCERSANKRRLNRISSTFLDFKGDEFNLLCSTANIRFDNMKAGCLEHDANAELHCNTYLPLLASTDMCIQICGRISSSSTVREISAANSSTTCEGVEEELSISSNVCAFNFEAADGLYL